MGRELWPSLYRLLPAGKKAGSGKHYPSPYRLRGRALIGTDFGKVLYRKRTRIERHFGNATSFGAGWGRCRRGCAACRGRAPGSGPSC